MIAAGTAIWRQRAWVWGTALGFLIVNLCGLLVYDFAYANRVETLRRDLRDQGARLGDARAERLRLMDLLRQARLNREGILRLYGEHFSTRRQRLTGITAEVKSLATRAGMMPRAISYPEEQIQQYGLIRRSFVFTVDGSNTDLRKFINLLELSDSFLSLESVGLVEATQRPGAVRPGLAPGSPFLSGRPAFSAPMAPGVAGAPGAPGTPAAAASALSPSSAGPETLHISLTLSTLFANREEVQDDLAPLPGAPVAPPHGRSTP
jgi:hypothetical protein